MQLCFAWDASALGFGCGNCHLYVSQHTLMPGLRPSEILDLKWTDFDFGRNSVSGPSEGRPRGE
jgi:hypothetical protein